MEKRGKSFAKMAELLNMLRDGKPIPTNHELHKLSGNWANVWDLHIEGDWLLLYEIDEDEKEIILRRTGTHADLFD